MKTCSLCKTQMPDDAEYCIFCRNKIKSLQELIQDKQTGVVFNGSESVGSAKNIEIDKEILKQELDEETIRFRRHRNILISLIIMLILSIMLVYFLDETPNIKEEYKVIQSQLASSDYKGAYENIDKFLKEHENSEYNKELIEIKESIKPQVDLIESQERNQEIMNQINEIGDKFSMSGDMVISFCKALDDLGINKDNVQLTYETKNVDGRDLYDFVYNAHDFGMSYQESDGSISIFDSSTGDEIYNNGQVIKSVDTIVLNYDEMIDISKISKILVNLVHNYSTVTKFPDIRKEQYGWSMTKTDNIININSYVNYRNENSIFARDNFQIVLRKDNDGYKLVDLTLNGTKSDKIIY